jgi:hypothetical protein
MNRYFFRITDGPAESGDEIISKFERAGVHMDSAFGVVPIDASGKHFLVRGEASSEVVSKLDLGFEVEAFEDLVIGTEHRKTEE